MHSVDKGIGLPLVLLHAFPFDSSMWRPQFETLSKTNRVLAPDLPGFGKTPLVHGWSIDSAADIVAKWLDDVGVKEPVTLGGLSMGGYIALAFARRHPQRLAKLILADTKAAADDDVTKAGRAANIKLVREQGVPALVAAMLPKLLGPTTHSARPEIVAKVRAMAERQTPEAVIAALEALRDRPDATPGLKDIKVPTLVIVGDEDAITPPAMAKAIADTVPGAKLATIPGAGHLTNVEAFNSFNTTLATFL